MLVHCNIRAGNHKMLIIILQQTESSLISIEDLNGYEEEIKCEAVLCILSLFCNKFIYSIQGFFFSENEKSQ